MYNASSAFNTAALASARTVKTKAVFNGNRTVTGADDLINIEFHQAMNVEEITIGSVMSSYVIIEMRQPSTAIAMTNGYVEPYIGLVLPNGTVEYVTLGKFYISSVTSPNNFKTITVTAYDKLAFMEEDYIPSISFPATAQDMLDDICTQKLITHDIEMPEYVISELHEGTYLEQLGWLSGLCGKNAHMNRSDELEFIWYTASGVTVSRDVQYLDGLVRTTEQDFTIHSLTTGTDENVITCGSGVGITHTNPYITQAIADEIFEDLEDFTYTPCELQWRGNPAIDVGDILTAVDSSNRTVCVMEQTITVTGGMSAMVYCYGMSEAEIVMHVSPLEKRVKAQYQGLAKDLQEATKTIIGQNGGYYELLMDEVTGLPRGWSIRDTPTITPTTGMWIFTNGGLGHSSDGGQTITKIALTADGQLAADIITTGLFKVVGANGGTVFSANMDTGEVIINGTNGNVSFTNCPFTTIYSKTSKASDYTATDFNRLRDIILGTITPTQADIEKYDFNLDGALTGSDFIILRNMVIIDPSWGDYTATFVVSMPASGTDNLIRVYRVGSYSQGSTVEHEIFRVSAKGLETPTPDWGGSPRPYSSRCVVEEGGYAIQGGKVDVSMELSIPNDLGTDTSTYFWMLTHLPSPQRDSALCISKTNSTEGAGVYSACISDEGSTYGGVIIVRYNGKALVAGDRIAINGSYWTE